MRIACKVQDLKRPYLLLIHINLILQNYKTFQNYLIIVPKDRTFSAVTPHLLRSKMAKKRD